MFIRFNIVLGNISTETSLLYQVADTTPPEEQEEPDTVGQEREDSSSDFIQTEIDYTAEDSIVMSRSENKIFLYKNAEVKYGKIELVADYIEYDQDSSTIFAKGLKDSTGQVVGKPVFTERGKTYDAETIRYNFKTQEGYIKQVVTEEQDGYLHGETTKKHKNDHFHFKGGKYTTCDKDHPDYYINITKGIVVPDKRIVAGPSYLVIADIPLPVVLPFGYFPIQQKQTSGLVMPSYGEESTRGFYLNDLGYYFGISDHMDLKISGEIYSLGTWGVSLDYRLMERYKYTSNLNIDFKSLVQGDKGSPDYVSSKDYSIRWSHSQSSKANPYSSFNASVDYSTTSYDKNHSRDMEDYTSNTKSSNISYSRTWPDSPFSLNGKLRHNQNTKNQMVDLTIPSLSLSMSRQYPLRQLNKSGRSKWYDDLQVSYSAEMKNQIRRPDSLLFKNTNFSDFKSGFQHRVPVSLNFKFFKYLNVSPNLNYQGVLYPRYVERYWDEQTESVVNDTIEKIRYAQSVEPSLSMGMSPKLFGMFTFKDKNFKVQAVRHVLTPSVNFRFRPDLGDMTAQYYDTHQNDTTGEMVEYSYFEGQMYRPPSPPGRSGNINFGLDNNLEMKVRSKDAEGEEELKKVTILKSVNFKSSYDIFADSLNWSDIRVSGRTSFLDNNINLNFGGNLDPYAINESGQKINSAQFSDDGRIVRLTRFNASVNMNLPAGGRDGRGGSQSQNAQGTQESATPRRYDYFDVPWNLSIGYNFNYSKPAYESKITQTIRASGDFNLTDKWDLAFSTHYDFEQKKFSATNITISRDLHCWTMTLDWVPFGERKSYFFEIRVNSSVLEDLKLKKRDTWYDNL
ncbi:MAG: putative LPS assembly protein LptD [Bacteroidales bacterium]